jgi:hypothetical protein
LSIFETELWITIGCRNAPHYEGFNYIIPKKTDSYGRIKYVIGSKIKVKTEHVQPSSGVKVTKICDICGRIILNQTHNAVINLRNKNIDKQDHCQKCNRVVGEITKSNNVPFENSIKYKFPHLSDEWDLLKNKKSTGEVSFSSGFKYWWKCPDCNSQYDLAVCKRTSGGENCPFCAGKRVNHTNSLHSHYPDLSKEWDYSQNGGKTPNDFTKGSGKKVAWICLKCNERYRMVISSRTHHDRGCRICTGLSKGEMKVLEILKKANVKFEREFRFDDCRNKNSLRFDFALFDESDNLTALVEFDGKQHYTGWDFKNGDQNYDSLLVIQRNDNIKNNYCIINEIKLIRIPYWEIENIEKILFDHNYQFDFLLKPSLTK